MMRISLRVSECRGGCQQPLDSPGDSAGENTEFWVRDMVSTRHSFTGSFQMSNYILILTQCPPLSTLPT